MTPAELIEQLSSLDTAGREALIRSLIEQGTVITGDINVVYQWATDNDPGLMTTVMYLDQGGVTQSPVASVDVDAQTRDALEVNSGTIADAQSRINQESKDKDWLTAATDPASDGGERVTPQERREAGAAGVSTSALPEYKEPQWVQDMLVQQGLDGFLTEEQTFRILREVNLQYGTNFSNLADLSASGFLREPTAVNKAIVQSAVDDSDLVAAFQFDLMSSGTKFSVTQADAEYAMKKYGLDGTELRSMINMADRLGFRNSRGDLSWKPFVIALSATGLLEQVKPQTQRRSAVTPSGSRRMVDVSIDQNPTRIMFERSNELAGLPAQIRQAEGGGRTVYSANDMKRLYDEGLRRFHEDEAMAIVFVADPALAARVQNSITMGRPISGPDRRLVSQIARDSGMFGPEDGVDWWEDLSTSFLSNYIELQNAEAEEDELERQRRTGLDDPDGSPGTIRTRPDPATLDETMRTLYQQMFLTEPDDATLARFRSQINAAIDGASEGDSIDAGARAQQFLRDDPRYRELYGRKPEGLSEIEYRNQFQNAQVNMLGDEAAGNEAVLAGMRSGKYQTTIGAAAGTAEAWDNSTYLGRLARAAQTVAEFT